MLNMIIILSFAVIGAVNVSSFVVHKGIAIKEAWTEVRQENEDM